MNQLLNLLNSNLSGGWYYSNSVIFFFFISLIVNCFLVWLFVLLIPSRFIDIKKGRYQRFGIFTFFWSISVVIPVVGLIFTFISIILIRMQPDTTILAETKRAKYPVFRGEKLDPGRSYGEGGAYALALNDNAPIELRLQSLINVNALPSKLSQSVNQIILQQKNDDVLLYAYVLTEKKREEIDRQMNELNAIRPYITHPIRIALIDRWFAQCCFEYVYFNLLDHASSEKMLDEAFGFLQASLRTVSDSSSSYLLLGRLYFHRKKWLEATDAFEKAIQYGASHSQAIPYLAEIAYIQKDFKRVREYLKVVSSYEDNEFLKYSYLFWKQ